MIQKTCPICFETFYTGTMARKYCSRECRKAADRESVKRSLQRKRQKEADRAPQCTVRDVLAWAEKHRQETGVFLNYGKAVQQMKKEGYAV